MSNKPDGGPAFPLSRPHSADWVPGMTLRDYFAGQALSGLLSDPNYGASAEDAANYCYRMADGLLAERAK